MSKLSITRACAAAALLAMSTAGLAQENTANTVDPALNTTTTDPLATDPANVTTTDPLANDPLATTTTTTDPLATDPMMTNTLDGDGDDDPAFPWGLVGLLGLAGLLGMKRRDDDVRVDTTQDAR